MLQCFLKGRVVGHIGADHSVQWGRNNMGAMGHADIAYGWDTRMACDYAHAKLCRGSRCEMYLTNLYSMLLHSYILLVVDLMCVSEKPSGSGSACHMICLRPVQCLGSSCGGL